MEEDKKYQFDFTDANIDFGQTGEQKEKKIRYLKAIDIDKQIIRIPFTLNHDKKNNVFELISNYWNITSNRSKFESKPCLRWLGGEKKDIVSQTTPIFAFNLDQKLVCFRIQDSAHPQLQFQDITNSILGGNIEKQKLNEYNINFEGKSIMLALRKNEKVAKIKEELIKIVEQLKLAKKSDLDIQINGICLEDQANLPNCNQQKIEVRAILRRKQGSFRADSKVLLGNGKQVSLSELKVGDIIKTVKRDRRQLCDSVVTGLESVQLQECVVIRLKNGVEIYTVASNMFYCENGIFKKAKLQNPQEVCLEQKEYLRLSNFKTVEIVQIRTEKIKGDRFVAVVTNNNYNLIINGVISHYFSIKVNMSKLKLDKIFIVDASPFDSILMIKQKLQMMCQIHVVRQRLKYAGTELKDEQKLSDKNIQNQTLIEFQKIFVQKQVNTLHQQTSILCREKEAHVVRKLSSFLGVNGKSTIVMSYYNMRKNQVGEESYQGKTNFVKVKQQIILSFDKNQLIVGLETYFELQDGSAISSGDLYKQYCKIDAQSWPRLKSEEGFLQIKKMVLTAKEMNYKNISTKAPTIVAGGMVILNNVINMILRKSGKFVQRIYLGVDSKTTIEQIKVKIAKLRNIKEQYQHISYNGIQLENDQTLEGKQITLQKVLILDICEKVHQSSIFVGQEDFEKVVGKTISFRSKQSYEPIFVRKYNEVVSFTLKQILNQKEEFCDPAYFCLFDKVPILYNEKISKIETSELFDSHEISLLILKSAKLSFVYTINQNSQKIKNYSSLMGQDEQLKQMPVKSQIMVHRSSKLTELMDRASQLLIQRLKANEQYLNKDFFHKPFLYFTSRQYQQQIYRYVRNFDENKLQINKKDSMFAIIKDLYTNMNLLPNYLGECYCGLRNFRLSAFFKSGQMFYWHNFTLAYLDKQDVQQQVAGHSGTLFYISSTNGKMVSKFSLYPEKNQILFAPFSYFLIQKIKEGENFDQVWLTEVASPVTFKKDIILWVDDNPKNNITDINDILSQRNDIQILQLVSTHAAEKWVRQFGWILRWKGLKFKLISDMTRNQWSDGIQVENGSAGLDLLQFMYKQNGYTAQTLIYCGNQQRAKTLAEQRNIPKQRYIITQDDEVLKEYIAEVQK